jgi:hypothetical protein
MSWKRADYEQWLNEDLGFPQHQVALHADWIEEELGSFEAVVSVVNTLLESCGRSPITIDHYCELSELTRIVADI